jgi:formylmethanofuran dehydrogenase subunit E
MDKQSIVSYEEAVQFHGHSCGGLALGYRMAVVAMQRLNVSRARNIELVAIVEIDACGVDAIQCVTGCTFGKGNLVYKNHGKHVCTLFSRETKKAVRVSPAPLSHQSKNICSHEIKKSMDEWIDWTIRANEEDVLCVRIVTISTPPFNRNPRIVTCSSCGELVAEPQARIINGKKLCVPCINAKQENMMMDNTVLFVDSQQTR